MKKLLLITFAILVSMVAGAQNLVWDGTAEPWTHGSGTEDDPYLIETPQNLAYLAVMVNGEPGKTLNHMFSDTCFLLAANIDLGGKNGLSWNPIGTCTYYTNSVIFSGHFDGGGHTISNMIITNEKPYYYDYYGLFGCAKGGSIMNVVLDGTCSIQLKDCYDYWSIHVGSIVSRGEKISVVNCHSAATIAGREMYVETDRCYVGGICGDLSESFVAQCSFCGQIDCDAGCEYNDIVVGGIIGLVYGCEVTGCHNGGQIENKTETHHAWNYARFVVGGIVGGALGEPNSISHCGNNGGVEVEIDLDVYQGEGPAFSGGILGCVLYKSNTPATEVDITYCYNVADLSANPVDGIYVHTAASGIVGGVATQAKVDVNNCYHAGDLAAECAGGIMVPEGDSVSVTNSYFIDSCNGDNGFGAPKTDAFMKSAEFVNLLNADSVVFALDVNNINGGYPVFANGGYLNVADNQYIGNVIRCYPNPASDKMNIEITSDIKVENISVFDLSGRIIMTQTNSFENVDISGFAPGVYVMKVVLQNGKTFEEKIVKK